MRAIDLPCEHRVRLLHCSGFGFHCLSCYGLRVCTGDRFLTSASLAAGVGAPGDPLERMRQLMALKDLGAMSDEEYAAKRVQILADV